MQALPCGRVARRSGSQRADWRRAGIREWQTPWRLRFPRPEPPSVPEHSCLARCNSDPLPELAASKSFRRLSHPRQPPVRSVPLPRLQPPAENTSTKTYKRTQERKRFRKKEYLAARAVGIHALVCTDTQFHYRCAIFHPDALTLLPGPPQHISAT